MEIRLVGAELIHADVRADEHDTQTDLKKLIVTYRSYANAFKTINFNFFRL
jgi:hypothetical protein